jgi:holliday junction DNA helicase RuvA
MISSLTGTIKEVSSKYIMIEVNGIGFSVFVPDENAYAINKQTTVATQLNWNQETGPQLYGFTCVTTRTAFNLIISCSGLGPKIGLTLLSQMTAQHFFKAIMLADTKSLSAINGIGTKKAEVMIMQLKEKVAKLALSDITENSDSIALTKIKELTQALGSLSYSRQEVTAAVDYVKGQCTLETSSFDELLRKGLSFLAKRL